MLTWTTIRVFGLQRFEIMKGRIVVSEHASAIGTIGTTKRLANAAILGLIVIIIGACVPRDPGLKHPDSFELYINQERSKILLSCKYFGADVEGATAEIHVVWSATDQISGEPISFLRVVSGGDPPCGCAFDPARLATTEFSDVPAEDITIPFEDQSWNRSSLVDSGDKPIPLDTVDIQVWRAGDKIDAGSGDLVNPLETPVDLEECAAAPEAGPASFNQALRSRFLQQPVPSE